MRLSEHIYRIISSIRGPLLLAERVSAARNLEEAIHLFESIMAEMLEIAAFESRMKRLGDEIVRVSRRTRGLEERVLPGLHQDIKGIGHYLGERERESFYRLKQFKEIVTD